VEVLLTKPVVVALAVLGAILSTLASLLQIRGYVGAKGARVLNYTGYGCMGVSMLLFVLAGLLR
jgi:uncharacterized protein with PQ loop repeat